MDAYIVAGFRTPIGKAPKGNLKFVRPDDLACHVIRNLMRTLPQIEAHQIDDVIVGNAIPEGEQGLNIGRMIALNAVSKSTPGMTVNRYCASGLETIAIAAAKIHAGHAQCIIAGGTESMSLVPVPGYKLAPNYTIAKSNPDWYFSMGVTAEAVAKQYNVDRESCDAFSLRSHQRAMAALESGKFANEIVPLETNEVYLTEEMKRQTKTQLISIDEGPRADTSLERLGKLKPVFAANGVVTAGNSSQMSDGAAFVLVVSGQMMKDLELQPIAQLVGYGVSGVEPRIMGIGPVEAVPKALQHANLNLQQIDVIELNEAFATQSLAVIRALDLDEARVNPNGGAIAWGHPLACTGTKLSIQAIRETQRRQGKYAMVSACVGGGQGIAGIFEVFG
jgi:acetyl-CoA acyltransferase